MKTPILFTYLDERCQQRQIVLDVETPDYQDEVFEGFIITAASKVIDYLDNIDKTEIMQSNNMTAIVDYEIERTKNDEIEEFWAFLNMLNAFDVIPTSMMDDIRAYASASSTLFGHGKSARAKMLEILDGIRLSQKAVIAKLDQLLSNETTSTATALANNKHKQLTLF